MEGSEPASRICLSVPTRGSCSHTLGWPGIRPGVPDQVCYARSVQWTAVVLPSGQELDLVIRVRLRSPQVGVEGETVLLERQARGEKFVGGLGSEDKRLRAQQEDGKRTIINAASGEVEAVIFEFSDTFSLWASKNIELFILFDWPPPSINMAVPRLPAVPEQLPREVAKLIQGAKSPQLPRPGAAPRLASTRLLPVPAASQDPVSDRLRQLARWLEVLKVAGGDGRLAVPAGEGEEDMVLQELLQQCAALHGLCAAYAGEEDEAAAQADAAAAEGAAAMGLDEAAAAAALGPQHFSIADEGEYEEGEYEEDEDGSLGGADEYAAEAPSGGADVYDVDDEEAARKARARLKAQKFGLDVG